MITKPTVLILGAGASAHFDYPVGRGLKAGICKRIKGGHVRPKARHGFPDDRLDYFWGQFHRGVDESIDEFLEGHPGLIDLGKRLIFDCLKQYEDRDKLFDESGWYETLFRALWEDTRRIPQVAYEIPKAPISIITFNYDRSLEEFLHISIKRHFRTGEPVALEILNKLKIIRPHGILGKYPTVPYLPNLGDETPIESICEQIKIISDMDDKKPGFCNEQFQKANKVLAAAERIIFLGFGFHPLNIKRLKFFTPETMKGKDVRATHQLNETPGGNLDAMIKKVAQYGFTRDHFPWRATCNEFFDYRAIDD